MPFSFLLTHQFPALCHQMAQAQLSSPSAVLPSMTSAEMGGSPSEQTHNSRQKIGLEAQSHWRQWQLMNHEDCRDMSRRQEQRACTPCTALTTSPPPVQGLQLCSRSRYSGCAYSKGHLAPSQPRNLQHRHLFPCSQGPLPGKLTWHIPTELQEGEMAYLFFIHPLCKWKKEKNPPSLLRLLTIIFPSLSENLMHDLEELTPNIRIMCFKTTL